MQYYIGADTTWKISEELAPMVCFSNGKQFCVDLGLHIHVCLCIHTHKNYHRKIRQFTSGNSRNFRDSNEAIVSSTTFTNTGWDSSPLTPEASLGRGYASHMSGQLGVAPRGVSGLCHQHCMTQQRD